MAQSHKFTLVDRTSANSALIKYFEGSQKLLVKHTRLGRTTISNFFNGKPIGEKSFRTICLSLRLELQEVAEIATASDDSSDQSSALYQSHEASSENVKEHCRQKILTQHSRMRLLSGEAIGVDQLYVDVWVLEKPERNHFNTPENLLNSFDIAEDRLALSKRIQRTPGFKIANNSPKLVILGKPGSGKTTFLKQLAVDWCNEKFQPQAIALLIELRRIQKPTWHLIDAIDKELGFENWKQAEPHKQKIKELRRVVAQLRLNTKEAVEEKGKIESQIQAIEDKLENCRAITKTFLSQKNLLILMDGLDEIPTGELRQDAQKQLREVSQTYSGNRFILTCRTQIMGAIPTDFTSVEVADFNLAQIRQFVQNWFAANGQSKADALQQYTTLEHTITDKPDLKEMMTTPVLLSLICVVWKDTGEIPTNRTNLYERGVNWLLRRWNEGKEIDGWEIGSETYRQLSIEDKEALLMEIAARKFESAKNFVLFGQNELVEQIYNTLKLDSKQEGFAVLKAIETQHGLLIERADELWSFSHLTFQEYFTVQWLTQLPSDQLAEKIANEQWKNVIEQLVKSQQPADQLVRLLKQSIDQSVAQDPIIQTFLDWVLQKSSSLQTNQEPASIRGFYFLLALTLSRELSKDLIGDNPFFLKGKNNRNIERELEQNKDLELSIVLALALKCDKALDRTLKHVLTIDLSPRLITSLRQLQQELPSLRSKKFENWWASNGDLWLEKLRQQMIECRNIGHDWQFDQGKQKQLYRYYEANKFLADLVKIEKAVSIECRNEISNGLLLSWAALQHR